MAWRPLSGSGGLGAHTCEGGGTATAAVLVQGWRRGVVMAAVSKADGDRGRNRY